MIPVMAKTERDPIWSIALFFPFCKKIFDLPVEQINNPLSEKNQSLPSQQLSCLL